MYRTVPAGSPWLKMDSARRYSVTFLATPALSRKACGSKGLVFLDLEFLIFIGARIADLFGDGIENQPTVPKSSAAKLCKTEQHTHRATGLTLPLCRSF